MYELSQAAPLKNFQLVQLVPIIWTDTRTTGLSPFRFRQRSGIDSCGTPSFFIAVP